LAAAVLNIGSNALGVPVMKRQGSGTPSTNASIPVKSLGTLSLSNPGFAEIIPQNGQNVLFVSSFSLLSDSVHRINNIANVNSGIGSMKAVKIGGSVTWPNDMTLAPAEVFGTEGVVVGGGFLVPTKTNGGIWYSANSGTTSGAWTQLISQSGWWYHRVIFADMDNDGVLDMVACRADQPLIGATKTMLVVLKPSNKNKPTGTWVETEIGAGCDALFRVEDLDGDGIPEVIATSYFTEKLNLYHSNASDGFADPANVRTVVLDSTAGAVFDSQFVDVDGDGKKDLLVSNHQGDGTGAVYAYEIPATVTYAKGYTRHTLASGFPVDVFGLNEAAPGSPQAFYPTPDTSGAPYIALAGDAAERAYVLVPGDADWSYTVTLLHDCGGTVGQLAVADVDGDGYSEVFVPCYDGNTVAAYTFAT
jgi:hypothetical protein